MAIIFLHSNIELYTYIKMTGEEDGADDLAVHLLEVQRLKEGRPLKGVPTRAHISCEVPTPSVHSP